MPDPDLNQIKNIANCREMLEERLARSLEGSGLASQFEQLRDDSTVIRAFKLAVPDRIPDLEQYLDLFTSAINTEPKKTVQDPEVDQVKVPGVFRQVQTRPIRVNERGKSVWYLVQILREGFYQELDWPSAKLLEAFYADGNSQAIAPPGGSALDNTTTDNPSEVIMVRFPNLDPEKLQSIAQSVQTSCTNLTLEGQLFAGPFDKVVVHPQKSEDGSGFCDVLLAKSKYTLNLFARYNTSVAQSIGKMWNVPMKLAQSIVTAWKAGSGRSADANFRTGQHLVDLVLTATTGTENLTTDWIQISCDTWERYNLAWGYTEAEADQFITDHSQVIGTEVDGHAIMSRRIVKIDTRGMDGLFDLIIVERSFGPHADPVLPDVTFTLAVGDAIQRLEAWGYNLRTSEITSDAFKEAYSVAAEPTLAEVGKTYEIRITREDDCSFDYHAIVTTQTKVISGELEADHTAGKGIKRKVTALRGATADELEDAQVNATVTKQVDVRVEMRDDGLAVGAIGETDVVATADADLTTTGTGIIHEFHVGRNNETFPAVAGTRLTRISGEVAVNDAGGLSHHVHTQNLVESADTWNVGSRGRQVEMQAGHNKASLVDPAVTGTSVKGLTVDLIPQWDDMGNLTYRLLNQQDAEQELAVDYGDSAYRVDHEVHIGDVTQDVLDLQKFGSVADGTSYMLRPGVSPNGAATWELVKRTAQNLQPTEENGLSLSNLKSWLDGLGFSDVAYPFKACTLTNIPKTKYSLSGDYYYYRTLQLNPDGSFDGVYVERTYSAPLGEDLIAVTAKVGSWNEYGPVQSAIIGNKLYTYQHIFTVGYEFVFDFDEVATFLHAAGHSSRWMKMNFSGQEIFYAEKYTFVNTTSPTLQGTFA